MRDPTIRTPLQIAMEGGFYPPREARDLQEKLQRIEALLIDWTKDLKARLARLDEEMRR